MVYSVGLQVRSFEEVLCTVANMPNKKPCGVYPCMHMINTFFGGQSLVYKWEFKLFFCNSLYPS